MKRKLFLFLCSVLCSASIWAAGTSDPNDDITGQCGENLSFKLDLGTGVLEITGTGAMTNWTTTSYAPWINYCTSIKNVSLPDGLTSIGAYAFEGCTGLTSVSIPSAVTSIGDWAFKECTGLDGITFQGSSSVNSIGYGAFFGCTSLYTITIPRTVTSIGTEAFMDCTGLTSVEFEYDSSINSIGAYAFQNCTSITSITVPNSVTSIGSDAFSLVNNVVYKGESSGTPWGAKAVNGCLDGYVVYSDAKKTTLAGCSSAAQGEITIPSSVKSIGDYAFYRCSKIDSIICRATTPPTVTSQHTFEGVVKSIPLYVTNISSYQATDYWKDFTNMKPTGDCGDKLTWLLDTRTGVLTITGSGDMTYWTSSADVSWAAYRTSIKKVSLPDGLTTIGSYAFYGCTQIDTITIPSTVTYFATSAFEGCTGFTSIQIPSSVTVIGWGAFKGCTGLASLSIPSTVNAIGDSAFAGCTGLKSIMSFATTPQSISTSTFEDVDKSIPLYVPSVSNYKAADCWKTFTNMLSIAYGSCGENLGWWFDMSTGELTITGSGDMTSWDFYTPKAPWTNFCTSIKSVSLPNGLTTIGSDAFKDCTSLTSVTIPESVTIIGHETFEECTSLASITIPNSVTYIGMDAFAGCTGLTSITIPNSVTKITDFVFFKCTGLTSITIPNSVTSIGNMAFTGCTGLTSITIPNSVTSIGNSGFHNCSGLKSIICLAATPPTIYNNTFNYVEKSIPLYVPAASISSYQSADYWKEFTNIQAMSHDLSVTSAGWATLCLPFNATIPENVKAYYASGITTTGGTTKITLTSVVGAIPANEGVVVRDLAADGSASHSYTFTVTESAEKISGNLFKGTTEATTLEASQNYVLSGESTKDAVVFGLYNGTNLAAYKAYLPASKSLNAKGNTISFTFAEDVPTAIDAVETDVATQNGAKKAIVGGRFVIIRNGKIFNAEGAQIK